MSESDPGRGTGGGGTGIGSGGTGILSSASEVKRTAGAGADSMNAITAVRTTRYVANASRIAIASILFVAEG
jgi:hypothetical protein